MDMIWGSEMQLTFTNIIWPAVGATFYMLFFSALLSSVFGFCVAILLVITDKEGLHPNTIIYKSLDFIVNTIRSFPFIILMLAIIPFTRMIVGTSIGQTAAIVPITVGATPFVARVIENSLKEVDKQVIEAAKSFGMSNTQIIFRVMLGEALPGMISGLVLSFISILGATAMAGTIGAGGLGSVALLYGYQSFNTQIMVITVVLLIILVQCIQSIGMLIYRKLK